MYFNELDNVFIPSFSIWLPTTVNSFNLDKYLILVKSIIMPLLPIWLSMININTT